MPASPAVSPRISRAMVLAAGLGLRMRPITDSLPKPLIEVAGRTLLDHALDRLEDAGVGFAVVNTHYLASRIELHLRRRRSPVIRLSHEPILLETGGGVTQALPHLREGPFFVVNGDALWLDGTESTLGRLAGAWDDATMDALLLLHFTADAFGYEGNGDFMVDSVGRLRRRPEREISPYLFTGIQVLHPRLFEGAPSGPFSLNRLYDRAMEAGRLYGIVHDGEWFHIGTPDGLAEAEAYMRERHPEVHRPGRRRG